MRISVSGKDMGGGKKAGNKSKIKNLKTVKKQIETEEKNKPEEKIKIEEKNKTEEKMEMEGKKKAGRTVHGEQDVAGETGTKKKTGRKAKSRNPNLKLVKNGDSPVKKEPAEKISSKKEIPKGNAAKESSSKKKTPEENAVKESSSKKETPKESKKKASKEGTAKKFPAKKKTQKEGAAKKSFTKKSPVKKETSKADADKESPVKKETSKTDADKGSPVEKETSKTDTVKESPSKKEASKEDAVKEGSSKKEVLKENPSKENSSKEGTLKEGTAGKSSAKKVLAKKISPKKVSAKKASSKKTSSKRVSGKKVSGKEISAEYDDKPYVMGGWGISEWFIQHKSLIIIWLMVFAVAGAVVYACHYVVTNYRVTTVYVDGNVHYTNEEIMDMVMTGVYGNNSLYLAMKYKDKGVEGVPFVERMDVDILTPNTIRISVYEKALAGYVEYLGRYMYFDRDGIVVESSKEKTAGIPQVTGLQFGYVILNEALPVENDGIFKRILSITQLLDKYELTADKIYFDSDYDLTLYFKDVRVTLGASEEIDEKIMRLQYILPELSGKKGTLSMENYTEDTRLIPFHQD